MHFMLRRFSSSCATALSSRSSPLSCGCLVHVHVHVSAAVPLFARTEAALVSGARPAVTVICVRIVSSLTCLPHTLLYLSSSWRHIPLCAAPHSVLEHDAAHSGDHFAFTLVIQPRCLRAAPAALLLSCCVIFSSRARRRLSSMGNSRSRSPVVKVARPVVTATHGRLLVFVLSFAHRVQDPARIRPIVVHCNDVVPLLVHTAAALVSYSVRDPLLRSRICPVHVSDAVPLFARSVAALVLVARPAVTVTRFVAELLWSERRHIPSCAMLPSFARTTAPSSIGSSRSCSYLVLSAMLFLFARIVAPLVLVTRPVVTATYGCLVIRLHLVLRISFARLFVCITTHTSCTVSSFVPVRDYTFIHKHFVFVQLPRLSQ
ncbi:hypothetical protein B0H11DRAFT_2400971 [Mycena galericulata]|nr:hypothetical protein B0H11DRAFT_2400971 [Mycena galericulata]